MTKRSVSKPFLQIDTDLADTPQFVAYAIDVLNLLPVEKAQNWEALAQVLLQQAWGGFLLHASAGCTSGVSLDLIEKWARWTGERHAFARVFLAHWAEDEGDVVVLRGWRDRYGTLGAAREKARDKKRRQRMKVGNGDRDAELDDVPGDNTGTDHGEPPHKESPKPKDPTAGGRAAQPTVPNTQHSPEVQRVPRVSPGTEGGHSVSRVTCPPTVPGDSSYSKSEDVRELKDPPHPAPARAMRDATAELQGITDPVMLARQAKFAQSLQDAVAGVPHEAARGAIVRFLEETRAQPQTWTSHLARFTGWPNGVGTPGGRAVSWDSLAEGLLELLDTNPPGQPITPHAIGIFADKAERRRTEPARSIAPAMPGYGRPAAPPLPADLAALVAATGLSAGEITHAQRHAGNGNAEWIAYCEEFGLPYPGQRTADPTTTTTTKPETACV